MTYRPVFCDLTIFPSFFLQRHLPMLFVYLIIVEWQSYHYCSTRRLRAYLVTFQQNILDYNNRE
jgi:hypothetical protein